MHKAMVACCLTACIQMPRELLLLGSMTCKAACAETFYGGVEGLLVANQMMPDCADLNFNVPLLLKLYVLVFNLYWR